MPHMWTWVSTAEFAELPGIDLELFTGPISPHALPESPADRATRLDVARDVLAELREHGEHDEISARDADYAAALMRATALRTRRVRHATALGDAA